MIMKMIKHNRNSIRLKDYDYNQAGAYFVTICTYDKICVLGEIINGEVHLNDVGKIVESEWKKPGKVRKNFILDSFVIMPDHLHGIIIICDTDVGATRPVAPTTRVTLIPNSLGSIIGQFKSVATKRIRKSGLHHFKWQCNYFERVIRNEKELNRIREYIKNNPFNWREDSPREIDGLIRMFQNNKSKNILRGKDNPQNCN